MNAGVTLAHYADVTGSIFSIVLMSEQFLLMLYHYNSYANNPVLLRSPKPMIMRDVFLTKSNTLIPNPLSCMYVSTLTDCFTNCAVAYLIGKPLCLAFGWRHCTALYIGSGFFSSFAYLFSTQMNKKKTNTEFDCTSTSNGSYAGFATLSLMMNKCYLPFSKRTPIAYVGVPYLMKCAYDEYIGPRFVEKRRHGEIELRNWGFVGGVFFSMIYASLFLRTKADLRLMNTFYRNIAPKAAAAKK